MPLYDPARLGTAFPPGFYLCSFVFIRSQAEKTRINKGFLDAVDGHCQRKCQYGGGFNHYPPLLRQNSLKLAHYTLRCRDGSVA